ncbi:baseplate J/gp47 family protein [Vibrio fluvialis]|uniref:baseplate J/gp47 family protein n=1 Tax=Vibrio fluvialis TaxID=676 RepID=UPI001EEBB0FA|nr:baseplate J/gp47 family protein [Vibrio fluvialis]MCG6368902.1 baseplate J/gp47 family protein [Vibrio fluvialis]MCG6377666.1 baseplate J/gp47 family protein [Vibrio fluvialis]
MSKRPTADFVEILADSGIPVTEDELETKLKAEVSSAGSNLSNDSEMSPFWRWVRAAVVTPVMWLIRTLLAGHVMPNLFVATAERWALELKAWEYNVTPKGAVKTQGWITFTKENAEDEVSVAAGTIVQTTAIDGVIYQMAVIEDAVISAGLAVGKILCEATDAGEQYNLAAGYFNILPKGVSGIVSAVNEPDWITTPGANEESDEELALRLQNAFTSSGTWHIDDVYRSIISSVAGIRSDNIFFENTGDVTPGTARAYVLMEVGATPQAVLDQLNQYIMDGGHHGHGDVLTCLAIPETQHTVIADVVFARNLTEQQKVNELLEVEERIRAAFRETAAYPEMTRARPENRFSMSQLDTEIHNHMDNVVSVRITVDGAIQKDIVSLLTQPRIQSLTVQELADE